MGIDMSKLALRAARAAIGGPQKKERGGKRRRTRRSVRDHLPPVLPLMTGAAIAVVTRAALRSGGGDWQQALEERLGLADGVPDDEDREQEFDEPADVEDGEVEDEDASDDRADDPAELTSDEADDEAEEDVSADAEPDAGPTPGDDTDGGGSTRVTAAASPRRMSPVRRRKLAESAARAES
jgi:hypothetical protein